MAKTDSSDSGWLFPRMDTAPAHGLTRMVAESQPASDGYNVTYRYLESRSVLNRSTSKRGLSFRWSVNPYRGCEFACRYCYARYTHEFMGLNKAEDFEQQIFIKKYAAAQLDRELSTLPAGEGIAIGTATDPYQPIERREGLTRTLLETLTRHQGFRVGIVTKSVLVLRDIELLRKVAERHELTLNVTITSDNVELARKLEPRAPRPDLRFRAVRRLRDAGLTTCVLCSPAMPGVNDSLPQLDRMAWLAKSAGASFFTSGSLFLKPCSKHVFEDFIREHFPHLLADYQRRFAHHAFATTEVQRELDRRVRLVTQKHKLAMRLDEDLIPSTPFSQPSALPGKPPQSVAPQLPLQSFVPVSWLARSVA